MSKDTQKKENSINLSTNNGISVEPINIRQGDDFSDVINPIYISPQEFAFDIFLFKNDKNGTPYLNGIYRDGIVTKLSEWGYCKRYRENGKYLFICEKNNIIEEIELCKVKDDAFAYVQNLVDTIQFDYRGQRISIQPEKLRETFLRQSHLIFNDTFLEHLPNHVKPILKDDKTNSYFFFSNTIVRVTKKEISLMTYSEIADACIWRKQIKKHQFNYIPKNSDCHFAKFINNVSNNESERHTSFRTAIGYLLHNYSEPSKGQAVICYDQEITDLKNPMGRTGKGVLANALKQIRDVTKIDGKKFDPTDKFRYQDLTDSTQIVWFDDAKPKLGFAVFHSCLTDGWHVEKKHKAQFFISAIDSPKMFLCSNAVLEGGGSTNIGRQFILEFSNHYSKHIKLGNEEPIKNEHGCTFFDNDDWNMLEWNIFFSYMLDCVLKYLNEGLIPYVHKNLGKNKLRQNTSEEFCQWVEMQKFELDVNYQTMDLFIVFRDTYYGNDNSKFHQRGFTNWLKLYASSIEWKVEIWQDNHKSYFKFLVL